MKENGYFVISLDFELLWGVFDVVNFEKKQYYFLNTRWIIPEILNLFEENNINCTWAIVGMLLNNNWDEWEENIPSEIPNYTNQRLSSYHFGKSIISAKTEKLCFAPELVRLISQVPGQEIGTHTYSHYYCDEPGQNKTHFQIDLQKAIDLAKKTNINIQSLVFPRNQLKEEYLSNCFFSGITSVRSNPESWYWKQVKKNSLPIRIARTGDAYLPLGKKSYPIEDLLNNKETLLQQKASRFLRPVENPLMRKLKIKKVLTEMTIAAKQNEIYHLWWHPHNFGEKPVESLNDLILILEHFQKLKFKYNFCSANMAEINESALSKGAFLKIISK